MDSGCTFGNRVMQCVLPIQEFSCRGIVLPVVSNSFTIVLHPVPSLIHIRRHWQLGVFWLTRVGDLDLVNIRELYFDILVAVVNLW